MSYISECPVTESAWNQRSVVKACSPPDNYHCVRTQDDGIRELCTHPIWIHTGECPVYKVAGTLDSSICQPRKLLYCPTDVFLSNKVFGYPACFPEKRIVTTSKFLPTSFVPFNITLPVKHVYEEDGGNYSALAALILLLIPVVLAIMILWKRKQIITWINQKNTKRHSESSLKDSTGQTLDTTGQTFSDVEQGKEERNALLTKEIGPSMKDRQVIGGTHMQRDSTRNITGRRLRTSVEQDLSMVEGMSLALSRKDMLIIIGLQGSGKSTLAQKIMEGVCCLYPEGANIRFIKDLEELNERMTDKETFINISDCIKPWFNERYFKCVFEAISHIFNNEKNKIHLLLCAVPEIWNKLSNPLLLSNFQYEVLDDISYKNDDWDKIFNWHLRRNIEQKRIPDEENQHVKKCREEYRKHKAKVVGKPTLAHLLCRSMKTLKNPKTVLGDPKTFLESEISGLLNQPLFGQNNQKSFVVLVYLMLHNGKALSNKEETTILEEIMETQIIKDICSEYIIHEKYTGEGYEVNYDEIEIRKDEMSIRSDVVVSATFDFVWKDHKELIIRHCDDELFLERITLTGCTKQNIADIARRFKSMINGGKPYVEHHYLLDNSHLKYLVQKIREV